MPDGIAGPASSVAQDLLWGAIECPSPEIVALALRATDWAPDDPRWHGILENGLYLRPDGVRSRHLDAFQLVLDRCDPDVRSRRGRAPSTRSRRPAVDSRQRSRRISTLLLDRVRGSTSGTICFTAPARVGMPVGTDRDGDAAAGARRRSDRNRTRNVGNSGRVGEKEGHAEIAALLDAFHRR